LSSGDKKKNMELDQKLALEADKKQKTLRDKSWKK